MLVCSSIEIVECHCGIDWFIGEGGELEQVEERFKGWQFDDFYVLGRLCFISLIEVKFGLLGKKC